jgi:hypothetical protein
MVRAGSLGVRAVGCRFSVMGFIARVCSGMSCVALCNIAETVHGSRKAQVAKHTAAVPAAPVVLAHCR